MTLPEHSPLGKASAYKTEYDASLLFPIPRAGKRAEIGVPEGRSLPFFGVDIWNAYEVSWLNTRGKPQIALASFIIPADTPNIVESKSFKLYLNSFNQTRLASPEALQQLLHHDLSEATGGTVQVRLTQEADFGRQQMGELDGLLLDRLDIETDIYEPAPHLLRAEQDETPVEETLVSHLLKSNCLVTGQPDWGSVQIRYVGAPIDQEGLLKYLISFRNHNEFHEQCVERIYMDVMRQCKPVKLAVYARYTRRGGLDINPFRTNFNTPWPDNRRNARQ
ncbi:7-cyano-7-deazaguanine reductase [Cupriavidus gilardii J11]|uniref:NADPH-dependent 7-cyano-7-deazaguanine reductase n=1 Tax=Cupriavidus gilardii J11 TaxID=936133 RepID=A0A562BFF2_9BURK|nr:NADPH-dependent 7-cyano-7-deazaguanine reductase QueF [Cupriavidus gilardii]TWG83886.1 7-cyano-7-deazaguanine reductase [Cupriavidus gilardii J11]